jgi:hypothetical protein
MAVNDGSLLDEDGEASDWVEIHNPCPFAVDLDGWYLTDDPGDLMKWPFPPLVLEPGEFLIVFASDKHRNAPGSELHANFRLTSDGELVALVDSAGNLVHGFLPQFPPQFANISYGLAQGGAPVTFVGESAACRVLVPASGALGATWTQAGFGDGSWTAGTTGVGYDVDGIYDPLIATDIEGAMRNVNASAYIRVPFDVSDPAALDSLTLRMKYDDGYIAYLNGQEVARRNAPALPQWSSTATADRGSTQMGTFAESFEGGANYVLTSHGVTNLPPTVLTGGPTGRYLELLRDNTGSLHNTAGFPRAFTGPATSITANFDFRMTPRTGGERADGMGFALLDTVEYGTAGPGPIPASGIWERPQIVDAFAVGFDIYNGTNTENTVSLNWNGTEEAGVLLPTATQSLNNGVFNRCHVEIDFEGNDARVTVVITFDVHGTPSAPVTVFNNHMIRGMTPFESRVAFGGRTGGLFTRCDLDNISVEYTGGDSAFQFEDVDISSHLGALQAGQNVLAIQGLNVAAASPDFLAVPELHAVDFAALQLDVTNYFDVPTPGGPNQLGFPGVAPEPQYSHAPRARTSAFDLTLSVASATAQIRYTFDGTEPTAQSTLYTAPLPINVTRRLKAKSFESGLLPSRTVELFYVQLHSSIATASSDLPIVLLDTFGRGIGQGSLTEVSAIFIDNQAGRASITGVPQFTGPCGLKIRGSSSTGFPKKQYAFETWDAYGDDKDFPVLGFPAESDWILFAPYTDKALMRDYLAYQWSNEIGRYAVRTKFCEVYLNTGGGVMSSSHYQGLYIFMEKIKRGEDRVDIARLLASDNAEPEITGGYIIKKDRLDPGDSGFGTSRGQTLAWYEPKEDEVSPAQLNWFRSYMNQFETALYGASFRDPVVGYQAYIDRDSWIDHHIMVEVTKNIDGFRLSTFYFKDRGKRLDMGPVWDYNLTLGNANYLNGWIATGWYNPQLGEGDYPYWRRLFQDPDFEQAYADRWGELRREVFTTERLLQTVDDAAAIINESQARNYQRWPVLGTYVWPNWFIATTWQQELNWMKGWLEDRLEWFDTNYLPAPVFSQEGGALPPGGLGLVIAAQVGTVYYTADGSDPRLPGGAVSPSAIAVGESAQNVLVGAGVTPQIRVLVPTGDLGTGWTGRLYGDGSWPAYPNALGVGYENGTGYESFIDVNVGAQMSGINQTVYIRVPFTVADPAEVEFMTLKMRYDDGFVAFINGTQVASANAPAALSWNAAAAAQHDDAAAVIFENFAIPDPGSLLVAGTNVLAIQGLNAGLTSSDMLIEPEILASSAADLEPILVDSPSRIIARANLGAQWSAPTEGVFVDDVQVPLRVTEVMYHPLSPPSTTGLGDNDLEFIEVQNIGFAAVDLLGVKFTEGIEFDFTEGEVRTLEPGEYVVVVENREAFEALYAGVPVVIAGEYRGELENAGEPLMLMDGRGEVILDFAYEDTWYPDTDGAGFSLHIIDSGMPTASWNDPVNWMPSGVIDGSPGRGESGEPPIGGWQRSGDANQDSVIDISDAFSMLRHILPGGPTEHPCDGAIDEGGNAVLFDTNNDADVNLTDVLHVLNYLFMNGPAPRSESNCLRVEGCPSVCIP